MVLYFNWIIISNQIKYYLPINRDNFLQMAFKAIYNWKFVRRHLSHLDFCLQHRRILLGYHTRIRNFLYLVSYIFCFTFCWLFYLDGMFTVEKYPATLLPCYVHCCYRGLWKIICTKLLKSNARKLTSISVFYYAYFLGTLRFYNKSFAIWKDSKIRK